MLNLAEPTRPEWFSFIEGHLDLILIDHTHLEKRAASTALSMIFRYTGRAGLPRQLGQVVREEMEHFTQMLDVLDDRNIELRKLDPAPYASVLVDEISSNEPQRFLDKLLVAGLIEARSCERFSILADQVDDPELARYYEELFEAEANHYTLYTGLARQHFPDSEVQQRLDELAEREVQALRAGRDIPRLHSY